jgi:hypothetical protein
MDDLHNWFKPVDQLAISIPIDFECFRLLFEELKDIIGRITASKFVGERVLVKLYTNLLAVVCEGFGEDRLKRHSRHILDGSSNKYLANSVVVV